MASKMTVALSPNSPFYALFEPIAGDTFSPVTVKIFSEITASRAKIILLDRHLLKSASLEQWLSLELPILLSNKVGGDIDLPSHVLEMPEHVEPHVFRQMLKFSAERVSLMNQQKDLNQALKLQDEGAAKLVEVGIALSAEPDLDRLLEKILSEGRKLAGCDAASLFLLDRKDPNKPLLRFKLTQNQSVPDLAFEEHAIPLSDTSVVGHCGITGEVLNIADAYQIDSNSTYQFNSSFDKVMGYRTVSLIAIPMLDHHHEIVGVLEFINRKKHPELLLGDVASVEQEVIPFDDTQIDLLRALSSQAAVAIENRKLLDDINHLFDGFVSASVFAIEQRDPCTSGHSFRVASLSELLAMQVSDIRHGVLSDVRFSQDQLREMRFAALLHDFGKVGVREHVLTKAKKLSEGKMELMSYRIALAKQQLQNQYLRRCMACYEKDGGIDPKVKQQMDIDLAKDEALLDEYLQVITLSNEPSVMPQARLESLEAIRSHLFNDHKGNPACLLSEEEFASLSIPRGSLNDEERKEIESHVTHTVNFLKLIPWTPELANIPDIAGAHHEKMDGTGYPNKLSSDSIPFQSRIMTVCDIYDALTAADRPYKPAVPIEKALNILRSEAESGLLDHDVVDVFVESKIYSKPLDRLVNFPEAGDVKEGHAHHVCDFDFLNRHVH